MTSSMLRRQLKNLVQNYSEAEVKVREATSNDPWGPSSSQMADISDLTYNAVACNEIMTMLWKRLKDDKNWRHIHKSLTLLEYLLKTGDDRVMLKMKENIYIVKALTEYRFVEKDGKDQGVNVREKAKVVLVLMEDDEKLKEEREFAVKTREKTSKGSAASSTDNVKDPNYKPVYVPGASGLPCLENIPSVADLTASFAARKEERLRQEAEKKETERRAKMSEDELKWEDAGKAENAASEAWGGEKDEEKKEEVKSDAWGAPKEPSTDPWGAPAKTEDPFVADKTEEDPFTAAKDKPDSFSSSNGDPFSAPKEDPFKAPKEDPFKAPKEDPFKAPKEDPFKAPKEDPFKARKEDPFKAPKEDPFKAPKEDPFNAPKDDPFNAPKDDPFNAPKDDPFNAPKDDPFNAPKDDPFNAPKEDPFNAPKEDPFNAPKDDPFNAPKEDPFNAPKEDPFNAPKEDPFNAPKDDPFSAPKEDPFNAPKDDPFSAPIDDPFNAPKEDQFKAPNGDPFNTPENDPFNAPKDDQFSALKETLKDDPFNAPKDDPFEASKDDPFTKSKDDPFGVPANDPFTAPVSTPSKEEPIISKADSFTGPTTPPKASFSSPTKPVQNDNFGGPTTPGKEDPFSITSRDDPFAASSEPSKEDPFTVPCSPPTEAASDPFSAPDAGSPQETADTWGAQTSSPPTKGSDAWGAPSVPKETKSADPWGDDPSVSSPLGDSDPFGDATKPDEDPWGAPGPVTSDDAWGSPAPPADLSPSGDPFGDGATNTNDPWGAPSNASGDGAGKRTSKEEEIRRKTASFLGSTGASLVDMDDLFAPNPKTKQQPLINPFAARTQAIGTSKDMTSGPLARSGAFTETLAPNFNSVGLSLAPTPGVTHSAFGAAGPAGETLQFREPLHTMGTPHSSVHVLQAAQDAPKYGMPPPATQTGSEPNEMIIIDTNTFLL
ncbi:epsin-3-like isoform X2 [Poeciliopsis prolifica]|uniref:epsin-3-like isoform X2 n=1 Tax=Poeciliopsis prolifica TaxID=188132 RepID=UPI0024137A51|nr:epsin-3-like isoform X2 [Poeciliopsis prolifica]